MKKTCGYFDEYDGYRFSAIYEIEWHKEDLSFSHEFGIEERFDISIDNIDIISITAIDDRNQQVILPDETLMEIKKMVIEEAENVRLP